jgi:uncharacterized membrane protein YfcA
MTLVFWLFVAAFGTSCLGGVLGMASGIFIVPILTLLFGIDIHNAIGASLISVIACSCSSVALFLEQHLTNIRLAIVLETATTLGALTGVLLTGVVSTAFLYGLFAAILLLSAQQMLIRRRAPWVTDTPTDRTWATTLRLHSTFRDSPLDRDSPYSVGPVPLGLSVMYGAGLISALLGIGSGVLKVPAMDTVLRLPIKVSSATSNFMIGVTAAASAGAYFVRGDISAAIAAPVALGSVLGALTGARVLVSLPADKLRIAFAILLALLAVQMLACAVGFQITPALTP